MRSDRVRKIGIVVVIGVAVAVALSFAFPTAAQDAAAPDTPVAPENLSPKNIIVMISDGCGFHHQLAARMWRRGDNPDPLYDGFPVKMGMSTFPVGGSYDPAAFAADFNYVKSGATDSAASGTAIATGIKTYPGAIGVGPEKQRLINAVEAAEAAGKATGVLTSVQFAHATPASQVAHNESRGNYEEIAREMIHESGADLIMGAGHPEYDNNAQAIEGDRNYAFVGGEDTWQALQQGAAGADADADGQPDPWTLVETLEDFQTLASGETPSRVIGIPRVATTLQQRRAGDVEAPAFSVPFTEGVPSLALMTQGALNVLDADPDGLYLMIEGGAVDWAGHANQAGRMIEEQIDFDNALQAVIEWVESESSWDETLLIVTADHETGYLTGPGADPKYTAPVCVEQGAMPQLEWHSGSHTNQLVPFFARGAGAEFFEQAAYGTDPLRGPYVDNTFIGSIAISAMQ